MRDITLVLPYFMNKGMLAEQQRVWADYPLDVRQKLHVVVVDDCSPRASRLDVKAVNALGVSDVPIASYRIFRLLEKKRWNWLACRNLGAKMARTAWMLLTDIDHVVPAETLTAVMSDPLQSEDAYRFKRVTATQPWPYDVAALPEYKPHNDTWLMADEMFFHPRVGGYDERLSGCYGTSGEFTDRLRAVARATVVRTDVIVRYPREILADASTSPTVYTRKGDSRNDEALRAKKAERAKIPNWTPLHGLTPWQCVYSSVAAEAVA